MPPPDTDPDTHPDADAPFPQAAAVPFRVNPATGRVEVLMIRRRDKRKAEWGVPKGGVDPGLTPARAAAMEALQEAGVEGTLTEPPLGTFTYEKKSRGPCLVRVYAMRVTSLHEHWDEEDKRERRWFSLDDAANAAGREAVGRLIRRLGDTLGTR